MTRSQFGFLMGFLFVWLLWAASSFWIALGAFFAGLVVYLGVRVFEGELDLVEVSERLSRTARRS